MDDPGWSWPAWKFGMKRDDLFTKLHDQYNTIPSSIQDPEAFHHDVYEISQEASTASEFHSLLAERKKQRLRELNLSLESASVEIIANPSLIGTEQWRYAVQLFQTKSLDSLVRYFASYLPEDHPWHNGSSSESGSDMSSSVDSLAPSTVSSATFFSSVHEDDDHKPMLTHEPLSIISTSEMEFPPSPRSMTMRSDASTDAADSPIDLAHHEYMINTLTPARTMSFSESDSERLDKTMPMPSHLRHSDDNVVQADTPLTEVSDVSDGEGDEAEESRPSYDESHNSHDECTLTSKSTADLLDSETPTPRPEHARRDPLLSFVSLSSSGRRQRGQSPSRRSSPAPTSRSTRRHQAREYPVVRSREDSPVLHQTIKSRGPGEPVSRIQKPLPEGMGMRGARPRCSRRKAGGVEC
jgi:hypothetical protein